ncbi:hypothetical protein D3C81_2073490 [compost metagenome]
MELLDDAQHRRHDHVVRQIDVELKDKEKRKKPQQLLRLDGHGAFRNVGGCRQCVSAVGAWDGGYGFTLKTCTNCIPVRIFSACFCDF